jgi:hypothetical protein
LESRLRDRAPLLLALLWITPSVCAQDVSVHGFADVRFVAAADQRDWLDGGLGKTRYGGGSDGLRIGAAAFSAAWQFQPAWLAFAGMRYQPRNGATLALTEAFVRWRPVSTTPWRWSLKLGAFFPPISLENDGVGWTSLWTLTPSALDTWVGEELRSVGGELRVEHRGEFDSLEGAVAAFVGDDPAGEILAARGWSLGDFVGGFGTRLREPDVYADLIRAPSPRRYDPFVEIDDRAGAYAELTWRSARFGRVSVVHYDNRADPGAYRAFNHGLDDLFAWRTRFTSVGAQAERGPLMLIAQAIDGTTDIAPPGFRSETHFAAGYLLAGWTIGAWRPALRVDAFTTRQDPAFPPALSEHGTALTLALNWRPLDWLRLTGEAVRIDSTRDQRLAAGLAPHQRDNQLLVNARLLF